MKSLERSGVIIASVILMILAVMLPSAVSAAAESSKAPKVTLNDSDPFEFRTIEDKKELLSDAAKYPESFDLRDEGCVTPVKLQNPFGSCWGFAAIGAAETSILGSRLAAQEGFDASTLDLSEKHLAYFASSYIDMPGFSQDGEGTHHWDGIEASEIMNIGGTPVLATNTFASGTGPVYESKSDQYVYRGKSGNVDRRWFGGSYQNFSYSAEDDWSVDSDLRFKQSFVLKESYMLPSPCDISDSGEYSYNPAGTAAIKEQLYDRRGVEIGFSADTSSPDQDLGEDGMFLSTKNWAHYCWTPAAANHAVQIVGWDDNYPRENFIEGHMPPEDMFPDGKHEGATNGGNGAWLVKNSWGSGEESFPNKGEGDWGIKKDGVNTGYFWLSYYDQSISMPEALVFDKANTSDGYYLDQYDFMQAHMILASALDKETRMANVFEAEVSEVLEAVSCQTTAPNTDVVFEVYLLQPYYQNPEDGILVARMEDSYEYGGFHKKAVEPSGILNDDKVLIQKGQYYSIVVTQKTSDDKYIVNTPVGYADKTSYKHYDVGIINERESFVKTDGSWEDYSDDYVRDMVFDNPGIQNPAFDNFPIKGFCRATGNDIAIRTTAGSVMIPIFRGQSTTIKVRFTGDKDAVIPDDPKITWTEWDPSGEGRELISIKPEDNGSRAVITPVDTGDSYLLITVEGVGTSVLSVNTFRFVPMVAIWADRDEEHRPLGAVYTGEPVQPAVEIYLDSPYNTLLVKGDEYTVEYNDNIKCGAGHISVKGAGELEPEGFEEPFPIVPAKVEITSIKKGAGSFTVKVKDQKESGITGYKVSYRPAGSGSEWKTKSFGTGSTTLKVTGLKAGRSYEVSVCGTVLIPRAKRGWALLDYYDGEMSDVKTIRVTEPATTSIRSVKANKKKKTVTVKWKKASGVTGYQISYSKDRKFKKGVKKALIKKAGSTSKVIKKVAKGKKYYFRIRTYVTTGSGKKYSRWSSVKSVKL